MVTLSRPGSESALDDIAIRNARAEGPAEPARCSSDEAVTVAAAKSSLLHRLFSRGYSRICCTTLDVVLYRRRGTSLRISLAEPFDVSVQESWPWTRLNLRTAGESIVLGGLSRRAASIIEAALAEARRAFLLAAARACELGPAIVEAAGEVDEALGGDRYLRHSRAGSLWRRIEPLVTEAGAAPIRQLLEPAATAALVRLKAIGSTRESFERVRKEANDRYVASRKAKVRQAARGVTAHPPTDEQAEAVATDEDVTLVLAGAGSGKTAVITAKAAHLVRSGAASPWRILVLAFNRKTAQEIRERLPQDLADVEVRTFHSFGRQVIADIEGATRISTFATDDKRLLEAIDRWLNDLPEILVEFVAYFSTEYRSPFDFETSQEYYDFVRGTELRTLSGDLVKSHEELEIANFLSVNGVRFEYEAKYRGPAISARLRQYQPAFYLPDHDLYIEHFALDKNGNAPPHFQKSYEPAVPWKRDIHKRHGTHLIEAHSWQCRAGVLRDHLRSELLKAGVDLHPVPFAKVLQELRDSTIRVLSDLLATFLQHPRGAGLSSDELRRRAGSSGAKLRNLAFLSLFEPIRNAYEANLAQENALDFNDLIIRAAELLEAGSWTSHYSHVLVDEFQDISAARMRLLKGFRGPEVAFFFVGDDWQSIYRFAGSDVRLLRQCGDHLGHVQERPLSLTFRYGPRILAPTSAFVQRNPVQTQREVRSASKGPDEGITVIPVHRSVEAGIVQAIEDIELRSVRGGSGTRHRPSVLALGRYNRSRAQVREARDGRELPVDFSTVHRAKGLEADYGIVLDLRRGGFPSLKQDDPVLRMVLPVAEAALPYGEERRLFYVATTRAKRGTYLIVDSKRPSPFVTELLNAADQARGNGDASPPVRQLGEFPHDGAPPCPCCQGFLVPSQSGKNLRCTNHPHCAFLAPLCHACGEGFLVPAKGLAVCSATDCGQETPMCPRCGEGALVLKNGQYGRFWACSGYSSEPPCEYTRNP